MQTDKFQSKKEISNSLNEHESKVNKNLNKYFVNQGMLSNNNE